MTMMRERLIRELAGEIGHAANSKAQDLARAAVCLVCDRPESLWPKMTDALCKLALNPPELGGFPRQR